MTLGLPIALDAMGGDFAPAATVEGALRAARLGVSVTLVGREADIVAQLEKFAGANWKDLPVTVVHASDSVSMDDAAIEVRKNKNLSINVAIRLLREQRVSAVVAQGHTGATLVSALFGLGRIAGVDRPAIVSNFPNAKSRVTLVDVGANADSRAEFLQGFALMGAAYANAVHGIQNPSVGLLSIGEERGKGSTLVLEAFDLLKNTPDLNFFGNVEGRDIWKGTTDVVVTDGFTGNIVLKSAEQEAKMLFGWVREALSGGSLFTKLGALLVKPALRGLAARLDPSEYGAQPLLGVKGLVFIGHGSSDAKAVENAILMAARGVEANLLERVTEYLSVLSRD